MKVMEGKEEVGAVSVEGEVSIAAGKGIFWNRLIFVLNVYGVSTIRLKLLFLCCTATAVCCSDTLNSHHGHVRKNDFHLFYQAQSWRGLS